MYKLYGILATISILVRQFVLPNPFDPLGEEFVITIKDVVIPLYPLVLNLLAEPILHAITFAIVGIYYHKGHHNPALGSFLYLLFYVIHVGMIYIVSSFGFSFVAMVIVVITYMVLHIGINILKNKLAYNEW